MKLVEIPWYTEGPVMDEKGNIYFTTLQGGMIMKLSASGNLSTWAKSGRPNGQLITEGGDHLVCDSQSPAVIRFGPDGRYKNRDIAGKCATYKVYQPNDLTADQEGGIYFTDSIREEGKVYYYSPGGEQRVVASGLDFPNGIALSRDNKIIYVAESYRNRILAANLKNPGVTEGKFDVLAELPTHPSGQIRDNLPDGLKVDREGRLWIAHYGMQAVQVIASTGELLNSLPTDYPFTSNLWLHGDSILVTGGYGEPGPGGLSQLKVVRSF